MDAVVIQTPVLAYLCAALALLGLMAYVALGGADFGGGVWDLFATGPRRRAQQELIARAMGPVWEANHVWLIFVLVVLFTCFPVGYAVLMEALFWPLHVVLAGIMLRGAAFVFRHYGPGDGDTLISHHNAWGAVFGVASVVSPLLMGWSFGIVTAGDVRVDAEGVVTTRGLFLSIYPLACGLLALATCAYLGAVYLVIEAPEELKPDFRVRAVLAGTVMAALAFIVLVSARTDAGWLWDQLWSERARWVLAAGGVAFAGSAVAVFSRWDRMARVLAVGQTTLMLLGWGMAHRDFLLFPDVPLTRAMAPESTLLFMLIAAGAGMVVLVPSLWLLFWVFKAQPRVAEDDGRRA